MTRPAHQVSPATEAIERAVLGVPSACHFGDRRRLIAAEAIRTAALWVDHDWSAFECIDHLLSIANELDELLRQPS